MSEDHPPAAGTPRITPIRPPAHRRLQVFALDPSAENLDSVQFSKCVISVPWEGTPCDCHSSNESANSDSIDSLDCCSNGARPSNLLPGPIGEYLEVVDVDPASNCVYDPVNLNDPLLLATDGHAPSVGNPQFHQQMVYAVVMKTIANFERVLGRRILWAERDKAPNGAYLPLSQQYVPRLRVYPHALREANAYYSPVKKALLFGYFNAITNDPREELPGGVVFTCLSHDIVAHETTHAILDGMHGRLMEATNPDMLAFHEAFADIVAIFQHFTLDGMLYHQIQQTRGDLRQNSHLAELASQFGYATNRGGALRNALGITGSGRPEPPDPNLINRTYEPHDRGAILVAAVFDAFLKIYDLRVADLYRIATGGTGVLPQGNIHPDLARRLAETASKAAQSVLQICIRAVDYLPPVDVTFGDYLRALVTADSEVFPDDSRKSRLAFIEAFRNRGIYPRDVRALGEDSLRWNRYCDAGSSPRRDILPPAYLLRAIAGAFETYPNDGLPDDATYDTRPSDDELRRSDLDILAVEFFDFLVNSEPQPARDRRQQQFELSKRCAVFFRNWFVALALQNEKDDAFREEIWETLGLDVAGICGSDPDGERSKLQVYAVRPTIRIKPNGRTKFEIFVSLTQSKTVHLLDESGQPMYEAGEPLRMRVRGGCTLLIDPESGCISYSITKRVPSKEQFAQKHSQRIHRQMAFVRDELASDRIAAINRFRLNGNAVKSGNVAEPFAVVHRHESDQAGY